MIFILFLAMISHHCEVIFSRFRKLGKKIFQTAYHIGQGYASSPHFLRINKHNNLLSTLFSVVNKVVEYFYACTMLSSTVDWVYIHTPDKLENMPGHRGNRTYGLWNPSPMLCRRSGRFEYTARNAQVAESLL